jgi:uncharacterized protein DUF6786
MRRALAAAGFLCALTAVAASSGCTAEAPGAEAAAEQAKMPPFESDLAFLNTHTKIVVLTGPRGAAKVAVAPVYQGRVMTSTTGGSDSPSFGWLGRAAIEAGTRQPHMNVFGGEDRFWLGPEGGQYALYFKKGDPFDLDHWQVPDPFDWGAWEITKQAATSVAFRKAMSLVNYSGTRFDINVERTVKLLSDAEVGSLLGTSPGPDVQMVAFESSNTVTNAGTKKWIPQSGLVSIWILGQLTPSDSMTIALPFNAHAQNTSAPIVNDAYFGKVPPDRLIIKEPMIYFRGDGQYRSKIGLPPSRALPLVGSYDAAGQVLTLVQYTRPANATDYVNSMWEIQRAPYDGDVVNSYNDGPAAPGKPPLGPFYELETSSPALSLAPDERYTHVHRTFHFVGPDADLDKLARATLHVGISELAAFNP